MFWQFRSSFWKGTITVQESHVSLHGHLVGTGQSKDKLAHYTDSEPEEGRAVSTDHRSCWWTQTLTLGKFLPWEIFHQGPHHFLLLPLRQSQLWHVSPDFLGQSLWRWYRAADLPTGVCGLQKPASKLQAHAWAEGWWWETGLSEMLELLFKCRRTNGKGTNKPSQLLEHYYLFQKKKIQHAKNQTGPSKWATGFWKFQTWTLAWSISSLWSTAHSWRLPAG